jgi:hypothetical protein
MSSLHGGLRQNLTEFNDDLFNCRRFTAVAYLLVRGSDPARMVLLQTITGISLGVWNYVVSTHRANCFHADHVASFMTNTNLQHHSGDQHFSNFSQLFFCVANYFLSASVGFCALTAIIRLFRKDSSVGVTSSICGAW